MENTTLDPSQVKGWGIDANPQNDPTYPIKKHSPQEHEGYSWQRPAQQPPTVEVLHSNERPNVSSVFGTSTPPAGLSGMIRRFAFKYSESSYAHWLPLVLADHVDVIEGILVDFSQGHIPNLASELGVKAEWEHNRKECVPRVLAGAVFAFALIAYFHQDRSR